MGTIQQDLPKAVGGAMIEFLNRALRQTPHRVGPALWGDLERLWSARRSSFRVVHAIEQLKVSEKARVLRDPRSPNPHDTARVGVGRDDHRRDVNGRASGPGLGRRPAGW